MRKVKYSSAATLDGRIARPDGAVDWLERFHGGEDYGMSEFFARRRPQISCRLTPSG